MTAEKGSTMATVGVLCARGRVEENALMAALAEAGIVSALFPPADEPLPVGPMSPSPTGRPFPVPQIVVDRHPTRQTARAVLATCDALGVPALCAGIAATGDRLDVASALAAHGLPHPLTALCTSEDAGLQAVAAMGLPATLLPLDLKSTPIALLDRDAAEAVLEHRAVLGGVEGSLGLIQAGSPTSENLVKVIVVDGAAAALEAASSTSVPDQALRLAEEAARALNADLVAIIIAFGSAGAVVWDAQPVPDFRNAIPIAGLTVAQAIAQAVERRLATTVPGLPANRDPAWTGIATRAQGQARGLRRDLVISA
jgi:[lysine-biosynthesis-protein LysW]---L-2-aminoadipate ligase